MRYRLLDYKINYPFSKNHPHIHLLKVNVKVFQSFLQSCHTKLPLPGNPYERYIVVHTRQNVKNNCTVHSKHITSSVWRLVHFYMQTCMKWWDEYFCLLSLKGSKTGKKTIKTVLSPINTVISWWHFADSIANETD